MEFTLLWAAVTAVALGWLGLRLWPDRQPEHAFDLLLAAGVTGLAVGRLTAMLIQGVNPIANLGDILIIRGGVHTGAAAITFVAVLLWSTRASPRAVDALSPAVLLALAGWHAGCLWRDACLGTPSSLPWAWALEQGTVTRHPVELYAAIGLGVGALVVSRLGWRVWLRSGVALSLAAGVRLITEPLRPSITGGPVWWYAAGLAVGVVVALLGPRLARGQARSPT